MLKCLNVKMKKGFTLIEILVAITAFSIVFIAIIGIFVFGIQQQKRVLATQTTLDQISYVLEFMSRALRVAEKDLTGNCIGKNLNYATTSNGIKFINGLEDKADYKCQEFFLDNKQLKYKKGSNDPLSLTSDQIEITSLKFNLIGQSNTDKIQPRVTVFLEAKPKNLDQPKIKIQTTISQRNLDY